MDYNFIEIGTSNFSTIIQNVKDDQVGISVEPISHYLDQLPERAGVTKVQAAITSEVNTKSIDIFWIPEDVINRHRLPRWFKGCNSINKFHPLHIGHKLTHLVEKLTVPVMTVNQLINTYDITGVELVKIDCEGHDTTIMKGFYNEIVNGLLEVDRFIFEANSNSSRNEVQNIIDLFTSQNYTCIKKGEDIVLTRI